MSRNIKERKHKEREFVEIQNIKKSTRRGMLRKGIYVFSFFLALFLLDLLSLLRPSFCSLFCFLLFSLTSSFSFYVIPLFCCLRTSPFLLFISKNSPSLSYFFLFFLCCSFFLLFVDLLFLFFQLSNFFLFCLCYSFFLLFAYLPFLGEKI